MNASFLLNWKVRVDESGIKPTKNHYFRRAFHVLGLTSHGFEDVYSKHMLKTKFHDQINPRLNVFCSRSRVSNSAWYNDILYIYIYILNKTSIAYYEQQ